MTDFIRTKDAAALLGVNPDSVRKIMRRNGIRPVNIQSNVFGWPAVQVKQLATNYRKAKGGRMRAENGGGISIDGKRRARPTFDRRTHEAKCRAAYAAMVERLKERDLDESVLELAGWAPEFEQVTE